MAGIYIHIPFCKKKCSYCDFYSIANKSYMNDYIDALCREIDLRKQDFKSAIIETIYFGGGTPSLLSKDQIENILKKLYDNFNIIKDPEITFEANPDDLNKAYLKDLFSLKINRLSIGIQSLNAGILNLMNRRHSPEIAIKSVINAGETGFDNINIDLIYGIDGLSTKEWEKTLIKTLSLNVTHLSAYHLGIEKGTLLHRRLKEDSFRPIDETESLDQYLSLIRTTEKLGLFQYEISNFAKDGKISKHNSSYWNRTEYIGLGPSAHSFYKDKRIWNINDVKTYISGIGTNNNINESEMLSVEDKLNELIMLSLRTVRGLNLEEVKYEFGKRECQNIKTKLISINPDFYILKNDNLILTPKGMFVSDKIIGDLFI